MYLVFARKYRPHKFEDVVGQEHVGHTLKNAVRLQRVGHAYLFCGSRGVGKTSMARILAAALNCDKGPTDQPCGECEHCRRIATGDDLDVMEIDGASNRGIDEVRELRQNAKISPAHSRYKIYYIDEVHMLTSPAFNALLKTLEEPPDHVKFIFSTTDPQQLPETVKSRCQRFDFRRISDGAIVKHLQKICEEENLSPESGALQAIARAARGGMRDALGTLDQVAAFSESEVRLDDVMTVLGAAKTRTLSDLVDSLAGERTGEAIRLVHDVLFGGIDLLDFIDQLSEYLRDLLVAKHCGAGDELLAGAIADEDTLSRQSALFTSEQLLYMLQVLGEARRRARRDTTGKLAFELAVIKLSRLGELLDVSKALEQGPAGCKPPGAARSGAGALHASGPGGASSEVDPANGGAAENSRIKNMMQKLRNRKMKQPAAKAGELPPEPDTAEGENVTEGIRPEKFRQMQSVAEDSGVLGEANNDRPLLEAFAAADAKFDLRPVSLSRTRTKPGDREGEETQQAD